MMVSIERLHTSHNLIGGGGRGGVHWQRRQGHKVSLGSSSSPNVLGCSLGIISMMLLVLLFVVIPSFFPLRVDGEHRVRLESVNQPYRPNRPTSVHVILDESKWDHYAGKRRYNTNAKGGTRYKRNMRTQQTYHHGECEYSSLNDLPKTELHPVKGRRHIVTPPDGGKLSLVCCETTAGQLSIVVHNKWAPNGADRFLDMVTTDYFNHGVPMMRCISKYLCQFGLNSNPKYTKKYRGRSLIDDPNWLPQGEKYRFHDKGVNRFAKGYLAYAGSGENSRDVQLILSLHDNRPLGGSSPSEVPWGEIVGDKSFKTLGKFYTGYGEDGPPQDRLLQEGASKEIKDEWPLLDYITSCQLIDQADIEPIYFDTTISNGTTVTNTGPKEKSPPGLFTEEEEREEKRKMRRADAAHSPRHSEKDESEDQYDSLAA